MIVVYTKDMSNFHEITHAISIEFTKYYNDIGKITMVLPIDDYNIAAIEGDGVIYDTGRDVAFTIQNYKYNTSSNEMTVNGYTTNWLLNKRVLANKKKFGNVEASVYEAVEENLRELPFVAVGSSQGFSEESESVLQGNQLLDKMMVVLESVSLGHDMEFDPDQRMHTFRVIKGTERTEGIHAVAYSHEQGTANDLVINEDLSVFSNYIYVQGELQDGSIILEEVGTADGPERNEYWLRREYRQDSDESEATFRSRMRAAGLEEIAVRVKRTTFSISIDPGEYRTVFFLGDIVSAVSEKFHVELKARVKGVKYSMDKNGEKVSLILGEPILTALGEEKLKNA